MGSQIKIWCQSCGALGISPIWNEYEQELKKHIKKVTRPETFVEIHGVEMSIPGIDQYHSSQTICTMQSIKNAIRAEKEGFDAFVMINTRDAGLKEIRELVDIPTVFMLESCIHISMILGPKFAFLTHNIELLSRLTELTKQYGLADYMIQGEHLNLTYSDWPKLFRTPKQYIGSIVNKIRKIIAKGADIIIPSAVPLNLWLLKQDFIEINNIRILDGVGCAFKIAEMMVDLKKIGVVRKKSGPQSKEMMIALRKLYAV